MFAGLSMHPRFLTLVDATRIGGNGETSHGVVHDGGDDGDVEGILNRIRPVVVELLAPLVPGLVGGVLGVLDVGLEFEMMILVSSTN